MTGDYGSDTSFRTALEDRLRNQAGTAAVGVQRLRRHVTVERLLARLEASQPGMWVMKGGMALEVRLQGVARATRDLDLGLRLTPPDGDAAIERLIEALALDVADRFRYRIDAVSKLDVGDISDVCRVTVSCTLAGRPWGSLKVDIGIRAEELRDTDELVLPGWLRFAGIEPPHVEAISVPRHVAEKFHGMLKDFGDRENSRTRDLVDIMLLLDHGLIHIPLTAAAIRRVFEERSTPLPGSFPELPASWSDRYETIASEHGVQPSSFAEAAATAGALWAALFPPKESRDRS